MNALCRLVVGGVFALFALAACFGTEPRTGGSQSNWLHVCDEHGECEGGLSCECGYCTLPCETSRACSDVDELASCLQVAAEPLASACGAGASAERMICGVSCLETSDCGSARRECHEGLCREPMSTPTSTAAAAAPGQSDGGLDGGEEGRLGSAQADGASPDRPPLATCPNGVKEPGELCDGDCPTSCADQDPCTDDLLVGDPTDCNVECTHVPRPGCGPPNCSGVLTFPDPGLEAAAKEAAGRPLAEELRAADAMGVTLLLGEEHGIESLAGIQCLPSLIEARLQDNLVQDLSPLSALTELEVLSLSRNQISDLSSLAPLDRLRELRIESNQVTDLSPLSTLIELTTLWAGSNRIEDVTPLQGLSKLQVIQVDSNRVSDVSPLADNSVLLDLYMSDNEIADITPLSRLTQMEQLYLDGNRVTDLSPLLSLVRLDELFLSDNPFDCQAQADNLAQLIEIANANGGTVEHSCP